MVKPIVVWGVAAGLVSADVQERWQVDATYVSRCTLGVIVVILCRLMPAGLSAPFLLGDRSGFTCSNNGRNA